MLHQNAVLYLALKRTGGLSAWIVFIALFMTNRLYENGQLSRFSTSGSAIPLTLVLSIAAFIAFIMLFVGFCILCLYSYVLVRSYKVSLRDDGLALSYGVFKVSDELLPFARIQEILTKRGILERVMGLASVRIKLAGGKPKRLQGLSPDAADALRDQVMGRPKDEPEAGEP